MSVFDQFEAMIEAGTIKFAPASMADLTDWGQATVMAFLFQPKIAWQLGDKKVGESYCLKLDHPVLQYLDILEEMQQFMWCTDDHHDSVHPDNASMMLIQMQFPEITGKTIRSDTLRRMVFDLPNGGQVVMDDMRIDKD